MLSIRHTIHLRGKDKCRKNCGVDTIPGTLWGIGSEQAPLSGVIMRRKECLEPLNDVLPVGKRHRWTAARKTNAEEGGAKVTRTMNIW
jgi:hypothetical protein